MKLALTFILSLTIASVAEAASPNESAVKVFVKAVEHGDDLSTSYSTAVSPREIASLRRVKGCDPTNLMRQEEGRYTIVWACGGGVLGMEVKVADGSVLSVATFDVVKKPNVGR